MNQNLHILVTADFELAPQGLDVLRRFGTVDYRFPARREEVLATIHQYDAVICDAGVRFDDALLQHAKRLRLIATPSTGTDHLDKLAIERRGIEWVSLTKEYELLERFTATAEAAWMLLLACLRQLPFNFQRALEGKIGAHDRADRPMQLSGKTLGVIGVGRLGRMVCRFGHAFGMRVIAHDIRSINQPNVQQVDFDTLLREADVISLHVHLDDPTRGMISRARIAQMKRGVVIVNTARGDLIDEEALVDALESGHVAAAGLDVVHDEWDKNIANHRLHQYARTHHNVVITPHIASACRENTIDARMFIANKTAERLSVLFAEHAEKGGHARV